MKRASLFLIPLTAFLLLLGPGAAPAWSLEPEDVGLTAADQEPEFGDPEEFAEVEDLEEELGLDLDEEDTASGVRKGGLVGIWQYTGKNVGRFHGRLFVRVQGKNVLVGRVKGGFKKTAAGKREMVGVVLGPKGKLRGVLKGVYGKNGFTARWTLRGGAHGKAKARFVAPFGRAGFLGTFKVAPAVFEEEAEE